MALPASKMDESVGVPGFDPAMVTDLEPKLINLMQQSEALVALMRGFFQQLDQKRSDEFKVIAGYIAKAKEEIREMRPHDISHERIPTAGAELEAITRDTENATHAIMNSAEVIMGCSASDPDYKTKVDDEVMKIFEACSFQDITGQRVSKVVNVLKQIEERVGRLANTLGVDDKPVAMTAEEQRRHDLLLNGPAIGGPETKQDAIDAMFDSGFDAVDPAPVVVSTPAPVVKPVQVAPAPVQPQPAATVAAPPKPAPAPVAAPVAVAAASDAPQSQDDIDALFDTFDAPDDMSAEDLNKTASQDDIDALFD